MLKMKLNYYDLTDGVRSTIKRKQDNDVTCYTGAIYAEIKTKLSWSIG